MSLVKDDDSVGKVHLQRGPDHGIQQVVVGAEDHVCALCTQTASAQSLGCLAWCQRVKLQESRQSTVLSARIYALKQCSTTAESWS